MEFASEIEHLKSNPHKYGNEIAITILEEILDYAASKYYNSITEILSDDTYDILRDILVQRKPSSRLLTTIGAPVEIIGKIKLPYWMGSADKIKPHTKELTKWLTKYNTPPYIISSKLDGLSALLTNNKLYTRGDGTHGQDISKLLKYIKLTQSSIKSANIAIRGEIIIRDTIYRDKYADKYPKARSLIVGVVNSSVKKDSKSFNAVIARELDFIAYELIQYGDERNIPFERQFKLLAEMGYQTAMHEIVDGALDSDILSAKLLKFRSTESYTIDGIIISPAAIAHQRNTSGNPPYLVAFKMRLEDDMRETRIIQIEWNASKYGILKPTVIFEPVIIGGDIIKRATGFNAQYINDNKLGVGAIIKIIKSGDVIPYIAEIKKSAITADMPSHADGAWKWNDNGVEAILIDKTVDSGVAIKRIAHFMSALGISGVSEGVITKLYNSGYDSLSEIMQLQPDIIADFDGFSTKSAGNFYKAVHAAIDMPIELDKLMDASGCFEGFGYKKLHILVVTFGISLMNDDISRNAILQLDGFSAISADKIMIALPQFKKWLAENSILKWKIPISSSDGCLSGMSIVISGFRSADLEKTIEKLGGKIASAISGKTNILIVKTLDDGNPTGKVQRAIELGITIMTIADFTTKYNC